MTFGDQVRQARELLGLTLKEVSISAEVRVATISEIETGKVRRPHAQTIGKIKRALREHLDTATDIDPRDQATLVQFLK